MPSTRNSGKNGTEPDPTSTPYTFMPDDEDMEGAADEKNDDKGEEDKAESSLKPGKMNARGGGGGGGGGSGGEGR